MNICYGIITHKNSNVIRNTINLLWKDNKVLLHVDKKVQIDNFKEYENKVEILKDNICVEWAKYSQVEAMLVIIKNAMKNKFDYLCLISGDDMPLKKSSDIKKFFEENKGKEFLGIDHKVSKKYINSRLKYNYKDFHYKKNKSLNEKIIAKIQTTLGMMEKNKNFNKLPQLYKGPQWFCISYEFCEYLLGFLEENPWYEDAFKQALCGDEVFFQTIIMNSKFKDRIYNYNENDDNRMALRYIDWKTGPEYPRMLNEDDFKRIKQDENKNCIFARKFNENIDIDKFNKEFNLYE
ncbi:beta-1,6-N-acetylglucosaminyltransferase [Paraclostridium bifermentans]|uniref:beta-1,6-N-acetylglucosaminyltransferase n=1 Tax=Paraclostridium bifermentans TaxID=1490 RepID=UPI00189D9D2A|nr:beta-1,6-N-acetylglucosaminyltransferase [Paraclostridium bifermentans]